MGNDVQLHESVVERARGEERRASPRHPAATLGSVSARIIGGSPVELVNYSSRGVLFECDSRLLIGARASVRITTTDANLIVTGRVVRSRVKGLVNGALRYDAALALDSELALLPAAVEVEEAPAVDLPEPADEATFESDEIAFESEAEIDGVFDPAPVEAYLAESDAALAEVARVFDSPPVPEPEPESMALDAAVEAEPAEPEPAAVELAADEPIAFEADAEVSFEASSDFEFEAMPDEAFEGEPVPAASEPLMVEAHVVYTAIVDAAPAPEVAVEPLPKPRSHFDSTYTGPQEPALGRLSQFESTPPAPVHAESSSSMFDACRSDTYDGAPVVEVTPPHPMSFRTERDAVVEPMAAEAEPAVEAAADPGAIDGAIDFETEVAFEAADAVLFEPAFDAESIDVPAVAELVEPPALPAAVSTQDVEVVAVPEPIHDFSPVGPVDDIETVEPLEPIDEDCLRLDAEPPPDLPMAASLPDDRVLLQFSATVPHDLAELRRIAADNQW
jgi:hypothetical protein